MLIFLNNIISHLKNLSKTQLWLILKIFYFSISFALMKYQIHCIINLSFNLWKRNNTITLKYNSSNYNHVLQETWISKVCKGSHRHAWNPLTNFFKTRFCSANCMKQVIYTVQKKVKIRCLCLRIVCNTIVKLI